MFRILLRSVGKNTKSSVKGHSSRLSELRGNGPWVTKESFVPPCRHYHSQFSSYPKNKELCYIFKNVSSLHATNSLKHYAQLSWKRISHKRLYSVATLPNVGRLAKAFSLSSLRYHLLIYGGFGLLFGGLTMGQTASAEAENLSSINPVYRCSEDSQAFLTSLFSAIIEFLALILRALYLSVLFAPCISMAPFADSFGPEFRKFWLQVLHRTLEEAGPAFIKWGQWAATRPDLFPGDLCSKLSELQSKAPEHSFEHTKTTIEKAFGRKISDIFESFDATPVASGSIAQVYRASLKLRSKGQKVKPVEVAVKVRHPGVGEYIRRDFVIINTVAKISNFIPALRWLRLDESVKQFSVFMMSQVDLAREAAHLNRFIYNFRRWKDVSFPRPVYPLVHPAVLVESFEQGESVAHYVEELEGGCHIKAALADIGTHALLKMMLVDNFIHADMHPGNILVRVARKKSPRRRLMKSKPHVVFLDVGMTAELSKSDQGNLLEFFRAIAKRDGRTAAECTLRLSKQQNCPNPEAFIEEVKESFDFWGTPEGDLVHPADCMHQLLEKVRRHRVNVDGNVCTVIVTTLVLEGWQRKLDPGYDMMNTLQSLLFKADLAKSLAYTIEGIMAP
ncbi:uncharacterized protein LOC141647016 [Silene latifolia]|uniref:uncharacterized protein LOC141647016 n=1 Tax=Silene latifolia TaxID=37657 RepID=UPI003D773AFA